VYQNLQEKELVYDTLRKKFLRN